MDPTLPIMQLFKYLAQCIQYAGLKDPFGLYLVLYDQIRNHAYIMIRSMNVYLLQKPSFSRALIHFK